MADPDLRTFTTADRKVIHLHGSYEVDDKVKEATAGIGLRPNQSSTTVPTSASSDLDEYYIPRSANPDMEDPSPTAQTGTQPEETPPIAAKTSSPTPQTQPQPPITPTHQVTAYGSDQVAHGSEPDLETNTASASNAKIYPKEEKQQQEGERKSGQGHKSNITYASAGITVPPLSNTTVDGLDEGGVKETAREEEEGGFTERKCSPSAGEEHAVSCSPLQSSSLCSPCSPEPGDAAPIEGIGENNDAAALGPSMNRQHDDDAPIPKDQTAYKSSAACQAPSKKASALVLAKRKLSINMAKGLEQDISSFTGIRHSPMPPPGNHKSVSTSPKKAGQTQPMRGKQQNVKTYTHARAAGADHSSGNGDDGGKGKEEEKCPLLQDVLKASENERERVKETNGNTGGRPMTLCPANTVAGRGDTKRRIVDAKEGQPPASTRPVRAQSRPGTRTQGKSRKHNSYADDSNVRKLLKKIKIAETDYHYQRKVLRLSSPRYQENLRIRLEEADDKLCEEERRARRLSTLTQTLNNKDARGQAVSPTREQAEWTRLENQISLYEGRTAKALELKAQVNYKLKEVQERIEKLAAILSQCGEQDKKVADRRHKEKELEIERQAKEQQLQQEIQELIDKRHQLQFKYSRDLQQNYHFVLHGLEEQLKLALEKQRRVDSELEQCRKKRMFLAYDLRGGRMSTDDRLSECILCRRHVY